MTITPAQIRAARHLLGLNQAELAEKTSLSIVTVKRAESDRDVPISGHALTLIRTQLEAAGAIFIDADSLGEGVRLREPSFAARQGRLGLD